MIMKSVTGRAKDNEDIISIIKNYNLNGGVILEEAKEQVKLGNGGLFCLFVRNLKN